ncbi:MAG: hypothetical protein RIS86_637 [Planctomycetota bacterium]|jgi:hypothetical protein
MLETVWPNLAPDFRDELLLQCVKGLRSAPDESAAMAKVVADAIKARAQTVQAQWRLADLFGTRRAVARDPVAVAPFLALTYMGVRKDDLAALYAALEVELADPAKGDLEVAERSATTNPPSADRFAAVLAAGVEGVATDSLLCMVAIIADAGLDAWQAPAREALGRHLAAKA